jgi:hypothetical protein
MLVMPKGLGTIVEPRLSQPRHDAEVVGGVSPLCSTLCPVVACIICIPYNETG